MADPKKPKAVVRRDEIDPEPVELIAKSIIEISEGMKKFDALIARRGLVALIYEASPASASLSKRTINAVLDAMADLNRQFIPKK